uniref:Prolyl endopeptidase-like n=1 Tax=Chlamydomonas euryale TaxID=1486919 RepID=A0A7R9V8G0_9CHLO|mmetsp:Transcript_2405/g.6424  ORF Transcript_2405/g.6424 Transcript_2405/m.6424 type:complete len:153 (+) Transcript_2405:249-707(+)
MSDETLPLVFKERRQWGNPMSDAAAYTCIRAYSPYDNLDDAWTRAHRHRGGAAAGGSKACLGFPHVLLTGSLNDARVPYHEPAKYAAKLRVLQAYERQRGQSPLPLVLLQVAATGGHGASSGGSGRLAERAAKYGFLFWALGVDRGGLTNKS